VSEGAAKKEEKPRKFQAIKGTRDLLPPETALWTRVERIAQEIFTSYGFGEIRLPIFEQTDLFARSIGLETDVVSKEMYSFEDRDETSVSLRPEATASVCRAYIENGMQQLPQPVKLYTMGPMFRRERPQKGRYRQFYQIDAEVLGGSDAPGIDAELIEMVMTFFERLGLEGVQLDINCIGDKKCRPKYVELLRAELSKVKDKLGPDSQRRIETNPLRVLDSKLENEQKLIEGMPHIADHLCEECAENYRGVKKELELRGVKYRENWRLVRGLDYYSRTTFEITAKGLGSQNAVCGGGRYDGLMELLGGLPTRATGFAIGEDRLILSLQEAGKTAAPQGRDVYITWIGENVRSVAISTATNLRAGGLSVELPAVEQKVGKALGQAAKLGAKVAVILGEDEVATGQYTVKTLSTGTQEKVQKDDLLDYINRQFV
jgi:histidyl-tRNA synthetase